MLNPMNNEPPNDKTPDLKHLVMQLNMGEGGTSVIVPIVAAELADSSHLSKSIPIDLCTIEVI